MPSFRGIFPTQGLNLGLLHCRWIPYWPSCLGSPRILEWVTYPFSRGSFWPRNWTRVSWIASGCLTSWTPREAHPYPYLYIFIYLAHCSDSSSGLPRWLSGKEPVCQCRQYRRHSFDTWIRKIPQRREWLPTPVFFLENPMNWRSWWASVHGIEKSPTWLSMHELAY